MPELPEVETIKRGLVNLLPRNVISSIKSDWPKTFSMSQTNINKFIVGFAILGVRRRAKVLMLDLSSGYSLTIHLKMTGQLVFRDKNFSFGAGHPSDSLIGKLPDSSTRVQIIFKDGSKLYFNDQRKFGWIKLIATDSLNDLDFFKNIGPEPLQKDFTWELLKTRLSRYKNRAVKAAMLDQSVIAGLGNIYVDESLWAAKIHPLSKVSNISDQQMKMLHRAIIDVLNLSISKGGSTDRNYVDAEGKIGSYIKFAKVYKREGQKCPRCGTLLIRIKVAGRGTRICPYCQVKLLK